MRSFAAISASDAALGLGLGARPAAASASRFASAARRSRRRPRAAPRLRHRRARGGRAAVLRRSLGARHPSMPWPFALSSGGGRGAARSSPPPPRPRGVGCSGRWRGLSAPWLARARKRSLSGEEKSSDPKGVWSARNSRAIARASAAAAARGGLEPLPLSLGLLAAAPREEIRVGLIWVFDDLRVSRHPAPSPAPSCRRGVIPARESLGERVDRVLARRRAARARARWSDVAAAASPPRAASRPLPLLTWLARK